MTQENERSRPLAQETNDAARTPRWRAAGVGGGESKTGRADCARRQTGVGQPDVADARCKRLLASPGALDALHAENSLLKKQLADLQASSPPILDPSGLNYADLKAARLQIAAMQSDTQVKQLEMAALENRIEQ